MSMHDKTYNTRDSEKDHVTEQSDISPIAIYYNNTAIETAKSDAV